MFSGQGHRSRFPPSFANGYATHGRSAAPELWRTLSLAFAPFLGPAATSVAPKPFMFGNKARPESAALISSGHESVPGDLGYAWRHTSITQGVSFGTVDSICPTAQITVLAGYRKNDATLRQTTLFGHNTASGNAARCMAFSPWNDNIIYWDFGGATPGASRLTTSMSGHTWEQPHVYAFTAGPAGMQIIVDGRVIATGGFSVVRSANAYTFSIGNTVTNNTDYIDLSFLYLWDEQLPLAQISDLSADPGMLFRPAYHHNPHRRAAISTPPPAISNSTSTATGTLRGRVPLQGSTGGTSVATLIRATGGQENTAFDNHLGLYQGRLAPIGTTPTDGNYVWSLGFDALTRKELFYHGDYMIVKTHVDVTHIAFFTARVAMKQPKGMLNKVDYGTGSVLSVNGSLYPPLPNDVVTGSDKCAIIGNGSSIIAGIVPAAGLLGPLITTVHKHYLLPGDHVSIAGSILSGNSQINGSWRVQRVVSNVEFELDEPAKGSGTYISGGNIGLQERLYSPVGFTEADVGRSVEVANADIGTNNGRYRILGLRKQPALAVAREAWVERPNSNLLIPDNKVATPAMTMIGRGTRWAVSLMIKDDEGWIERARMVQRPTQSQFFRADLKAYVKHMLGDRDIGVRLMLIESRDNEIYPLSTSV